MFAPFNNHKAYAVTDTPVPSPTPTLAGTLDCGTTTTNGIICTKVNANLLMYTGSFYGTIANGGTRIRMSFIKTFPSMVYFRMEERGVSDFLYNYWGTSASRPMQVRYSDGVAPTATILPQGVNTTHYDWTSANSGFEFLVPGIQDFAYNDTPNSAASHAFVVTGSDAVAGKVFRFNSYSGASSSTGIPDNTGAPHASGGGKMYVSTIPLIVTPTPTLTPTPTSTPTFAPTATSTPITPTPRSNGSGPCWASSGYSWPIYSIYYKIDASIPPSWINSINNAANAWTNVTPSPLTFIYSQDTSNIISLGYVENYYVPAYVEQTFAGSTLIKTILVFNDQRTFDINIPPAASAFSVQDLATHELGHWVSLDDVYGADCFHVTMFGGSSAGGFERISLEVEDQNGINWLYP
jgi:hypothetical protein